MDQPSAGNYPAEFKTANAAGKPRSQKSKHGTGRLKHVISYSGGITSWAAAKLVQTRIAGAEDDVVLLFADTKSEASDVYDFIKAGAANIGRNVTTVCDGRTPWEVFRDERFLGNSLIDPCSKILKRELMDRWRRNNCDPLTSRHYIGVDFTEINRYKTHKAGLGKRGWQCEAPLIRYRMSKPKALEWAIAEGLSPPDAYKEGFSHANCAGMCIKAGKHHWARLYQLHPDRYLYAERQEQGLREYLKRDVTILVDRRGEERIPVTLRELRRRLEAGVALPFEPEEGGCGCALEDVLESRNAADST